MDERRVRRSLSSIRIASSVPILLKMSKFRFSTHLIKQKQLWNYHSCAIGKLKMPTIIMMFKCERNHNNFKGLESKDDITQLTEPKDGSRDDRLS